MKHGLALVAVAAAVAGAPALGATEPTKITFSSWVVTTEKGTATVQPGTTYKHCPSNPVMKLVVKGKMSHPGKKGVHYAITWMRNGNFVTGQDYHTGKHGKVRAVLAGGGAPIQNGKWEVFAFRQGQPVGKTSLRIKGSQSAC